MRFFSLPLLLAPLSLSAQLVPAGQPIPKGANPPVVFLNGYQFSCPDTFSTTFGIADQVLAFNGIASVFFDNCTVPGIKPQIETLGAGFGTFLAGLTYTDGSPVTTVDVIAHSMGGLIVRTYLSGKQASAPGMFSPPEVPGIRKAIFLGTPHFGAIAASNFGIDAQADAMALGSQFLFDLNTWNQGTDDLRGIDAIAVAGDAGTGLDSGVPNFDDGVVAVTSASLGFSRPARTRVVPYCHTKLALLINFDFCPANAPYLAEIVDPAGVVAQILTSFLTGTTAWQSLGSAAETDPVASIYSGLIVEAQTAGGVEQSVASATAGTNSLKTTQKQQTAFSERLISAPAAPLKVTVAGPVTLDATIQLAASASQALVVKPGPLVFRALPAASAVFPLNVAPGQFVAIYGSNLSSTTEVAPTAVYPAQLADVQVTANATPAQVEFISPGQINIVFPDGASGLAALTVTNSSGSHTINVLTAAAVPSIFTLDSSGSGPAAALNAVTSQVVGAAAALHAGDYVSLYLTGLGATTSQNGLQYAQTVPTVSIGGASCVVAYAGRAPGFAGLDQINCQLGPGTPVGAAVPVVVTSGDRESNTATLDIQ